MLIPQKAEFNLTNQYYETIAKAQNYIYTIRNKVAIAFKL